MNPVLVRNGRPEQTALILSVPHGGRVFPAELRDGLTVDPRRLWSDWQTDVLFDFDRELPVPTVIARLSRFVADPNRDPDGPLHGSFWSTAVPASDPWGAALYAAPLGADQLEARIAAAHRPYHDALDQLVEASLAHHARVLLLDLHSFGLPLDADVIVGDRTGTTARPDVADTVADAFAGAGLRVARNTRFPGGRIIGRWASDDRVDAVQIELDQRRYLVPADVDEARPDPRRDDSAWSRTREVLRDVLSQVARL